MGGRDWKDILGGGNSMTEGTGAWKNKHICAMAGRFVMPEARICGFITGNKTANGNRTIHEELDQV